MDSNFELADTSLNASCIHYINYSDLLFNGNLATGAYTATKPCYFITLTVAVDSSISNYEVKVNNIDVSLVDSSPTAGVGVRISSGVLQTGDILSGKGAARVYGLY